MLCLEGIARALNVFNGRVAAPDYTVADMTGGGQAGGWGRARVACMLPSPPATSAAP
jgi:hypothetical protein